MSKENKVSKEIVDRQARDIRSINKHDNDKDEKMRTISNKVVETKILMKKLQKESNEDYKIIKKNHETI